MLDAPLAVRAIRRAMKERFNLDHVTIQIEDQHCGMKKSNCACDHSPSYFRAWQSASRGSLKQSVRNIRRGGRLPYVTSLSLLTI
jgi:hypothetical protein